MNQVVAVLAAKIRFQHSMASHLILRKVKLLALLANLDAVNQLLDESFPVWTPLRQVKSSIKEMTLQRNHLLQCVRCVKRFNLSSKILMHPLIHVAKLVQSSKSQCAFMGLAKMSVVPAHMSYLKKLV